MLGKRFRHHVQQYCGLLSTEAAGPYLSSHLQRHQKGQKFYKRGTLFVQQTEDMRRQLTKPLYKEFYSNNANQRLRQQEFLCRQLLAPFYLDFHFPVIVTEPLSRYSNHLHVSLQPPLLLTESSRYSCRGVLYHSICFNSFCVDACYHLRFDFLRFFHFCRYSARPKNFYHATV